MRKITFFEPAAVSIYSFLLRSILTPVGIHHQEQLLFMIQVSTINSIFLFIILMSSTTIIHAQDEEEEEIIDSIIAVPVSKAAVLKPELFSSGFIDIFNTGQVNASARFVRLYIGEPGKFTLPLSLYSGVSSNNFQRTIDEKKSNNILLANLINPLSGLANISMEGVAYFRKNEKITKAGILYHVGERLLTGIKTGSEDDDPEMGQPYNFLNSFFSTGLYFQTGAWERTNSKNVGIAWIALRYMGCYTNPDQLKKFMPGLITHGFYHGYSLAWGIEINSTLNIKMIYYKYLKRPEIDPSQTIYQFSFNYSLKK